MLALVFEVTVGRRNSLPASSITCSIVGLQLLYLLVENQLSEFHSEVRTAIPMLALFITCSSLM